MIIHKTGSVAQPSDGAQDLVSRGGREAIVLPSSSVSADGYDSVGTSFDDRAMAAPRVIGTVGGDSIDQLVPQYLTGQFGKQWTVALAA